MFGRGIWDTHSRSAVLSSLIFELCSLFDSETSLANRKRFRTFPFYRDAILDRQKIKFYKERKCGEMRESRRTEKRPVFSSTIRGKMTNLPAD